MFLKIFSLEMKFCRHILEHLFFRLGIKQKEGPFPNLAEASYKDLEFS